MICRRRRVILVALLLGLAWFILVPSLSKTSVNSKVEDVREDHPVVTQFLFSKESSWNKKIRSRHEGRAKKNLVAMDDLSEIDYPVAEEKPALNTSVHSDRRSLISSRSGAALIPRHRFTTLLRSENVAVYTGKRISAPGHKGRMVHIDPTLLSLDERKIYDDGWQKYFHNEHVNNLVSSQRILQDVRDPACRSLEYDTENFPDASVIIVFHNEAWMTLVRTVHSVLDRSPDKLLKEVILVDDSSNLDHLKTQLSNYVSHLSKVRLMRLLTRKGASYARHMGASLATGKVLVFLDAHCECSTGWLEPLLAQVAKNSSNVAVPVLDIIDDDTFAYKAYDLSRIKIGGLDWSLSYQWIEIPDREKRRRKNNFDPIRNPVMWGGIFAISRDFYYHLGGLDLSLHYLGAGQNTEMSFKIWLCGGRLETIPCSHVGHLFHHQIGHRPPSYVDLTLRNYATVALMWLDELKDIHFQKTGYSPPLAFVNASNHLEFRNRLHCNSFDWYLRNVYPELFAPSLAVASGKIRSKMRLSSTNEGKASLCLSIAKYDAEKRPTVSKCRSLEDNDKAWLLSRTGEIRQGDSCLDYPGEYILTFPCHGGRGNQEWTYMEDQTIQQIGTKRCLTLTPNAKSVVMAQCTGSDFQIWYWKRNSEAESPKGVSQSVIRQELAVVSI